MAGAKAQLVKWGNSQAVRIPKNILRTGQPAGRRRVEIRVQNGYIWLEAVCATAYLEALVRKITRDNRHGEQDWGKPMGNEVW